MTKPRKIKPDVSRPIEKQRQKKHCLPALKDSKGIDFPNAENAGVVSNFTTAGSVSTSSFQG